MSWASHAIAVLREGQRVVVRPPGNSMRPLIAHRDPCQIDPLGTRALAAGDIVLCRVGRAHYLHKVISVRNDRYAIGNNRGHINGTIGRDSIYGILTAVGQGDAREAN